jgi:uncharacterized protein (TIGR00299 family) protein
MHEHSHEHVHLHDHGDHTHRRLPDILKLIEQSDISPQARDLAARIFTRLARAESRVHGIAPEAVQFHEVGAIDAIIDVVGFAIGYCLFGIEKSVCSAAAIGSGKVRTEHGFFPAPGPATVYLLAEVGAATSQSSIPFECLTPTGAAILCEIASSWGIQPAMQRVSGVGYGAGSKDPADWPNVVRVIIGEQDATETSSPKFDQELVSVIEANLDDFSPQALSFVMDKLLQAGALDVTVVPAVMKKGRSGHLLSVLSRLEDTALLQEMILSETSTIGVRWHTVQRLVASREWQDVSLARGGTVRIKLARDKFGRLINAQPEYDDCARYATEHQVPLKDVLAEAITVFHVTK